MKEKKKISKFKAVFLRTKKQRERAEKVFAVLNSGPSYNWKFLAE